MVDHETRLSSFFMLLLSSTSLVVILSNFFSGNFSQRTQAQTNSAMPAYDNFESGYPVYEVGEPVEEMVVEEFPEEDGNTNLEEGTFLENSEDALNVEEEDAIAQ